MVKIKPIDVTAKRMGSMLRRARYMCGMSMDDASYILRIMPDELVAYERGVKEVPLNILEHMFIMGYKMMQVRIIEHRYHNHRMQYRKIKETNADARK